MAERPTEPMPGSHRARRLALAAALVGAFASAYLLVEYLGGPGICLTGGGCDEVRNSAFAYPLGIPLPLVGLGFYAVAVVALLVGMRRRRILGAPATAAVLGWATLGVVASAALTGIEAFVIGAVCSWCLLQAASSVVLLGAVLWLRRSGQPAEHRALRTTSRARRSAAALVHDERRSMLRFTGMAAGLLAVAFGALLVIPALDAPAQAQGGPGVADGRPVLGSGPVAVTVFSDFECPACAVAAPLLEQVASSGASVTYRYFPLTGIHDNALPAARAAEAAHRQGRFWEMHDLLFASQSAWAGTTPERAAAVFEELAAQAGLDIARWRSDLATVEAAVQADLSEAQRLGLPGTPAIFVAGTRYEGPLMLDALAAAIAAAD